MNQTQQNNTSLYISHGGGPLPLLGDPDHQALVDHLKQLANDIPQPDAIIVFSAHWEETKVHITCAKQPELIYDYNGFPEAAYHIQYPVPGAPELAEDISDCFKTAQIEHELTDQRGLDHGVFVPLKIMYPDAHIPCVQVSLLSNLNPAQHINIGKALQGLQGRNLLFIGSGFSFHNMRAFFSPDTPTATQANEEFDHWLNEVCADKHALEAERAKALINWQSAPGARYCHPREEHLIPLHVCYGLNESPCETRYQIKVLGKKASAFKWA